MNNWGQIEKNHCYSYFIWSSVVLFMSKAPCKRTQLCGPTTLVIVGCYMLRPFAHPVASCWKMLGIILNRSNFWSQQLPTFHLFCGRRSVAQQLWIPVHRSNVFGVTHAHYTCFKGRTIRKVMAGGGGWGGNKKEIHARENAKEKNSCNEEGKEKNSSRRKVQLWLFQKLWVSEINNITRHNMNKQKSLSSYWKETIEPFLL